jgi:hypothetical protein
MPIITLHHHSKHGDHGPPVRSGSYWGAQLICDCYDGAEDSPPQPSGQSYQGGPWGAQFVEAALAWNEWLEDMDAAGEPE